VKADAFSGKAMAKNANATMVAQRLIQIFFEFRSAVLNAFMVAGLCG
jgi:hypothetical protein